jgi:hypothetical protein
VADVIDAASLGEVGWVDATRRPRAAGVLPLLWQGTPVLSLTLDRSELAVSLAGAEAVDLLVREPRNTGRRWQPTGWRCRSRLVEDLDGEAYRDELVLQELRRYPPARRYADSPLLMRENWWFLPRLLVVLEPVEALPGPGPAGDAGELLLVTPDDGRPATSGVRREGEELVHRWGPQPEPGPGVVLGQDATFPDLEVWNAWTRPVEVGDGRVVPTAPLPDPSPARAPGLMARWRAERQFSAGCRRGLAAWRS